jgi:hypothetical protein
MSKVLEIRAKYPNITESTFNKMVEGDQTKTKKYLEYMCWVWNDKFTSGYPLKSSTKLIEFVNKFENFLPYIQEKDIYNPLYRNYPRLVEIVNKAEEVRESKTFVREEHITVLLENDDYLLLYPKTFKGSLKYGSGTRWCTASKNSPTHFRDYQKSGCLVYLVSKKENKNTNYNKVAFYINNNNPLSGNISVYNSYDTGVQETTLEKNGWDSEELMKIILTVRIYAKQWYTIKDSVSHVSRVMSVLKDIDLGDFEKHLKIVQSFDNSKFGDAQEQLDKFITKINQYNLNLAD